MCRFIANQLSSELWLDGLSAADEREFPADAVFKLLTDARRWIGEYMVL